MEKTLDDFFSDNDVRIGKDFQVNPPIYYQSLNEGLYNYFNTIKSQKQSITSLIFHDGWPRESIGFSFNDSDATVFTILGLHRFFELLLKDILGRINPFLSVKFLENEKQVIAYLNNSLDSEDVQTIEFSEAYKRFKRAINYANEYPSNEAYQLADKFKFLLADDTMQRLASWRNRIIHNGKTLPNIFALDFLVTQKVFPLVSQILETEKDYIKNYRPRYFTSPSGIDILQQFLEIKFNHTDFYLSPKPSYLRVGLLKIAHLKEIARACFHFDPLLPKNSSWFEPYYEKPLEKCLRFAEAERKSEHFHDIRVCPCCGIESLVVYKKMIPKLSNMSETDEYYFSRCTSCNYLLPENMGEPFRLGLYSDQLFHRKPLNKKINPN